MRLNHLNLTVTDVPAAAAFLETYFGMRSQDGERTNKNFTVLFDDAGIILTLMKAGHGTEVKYPANFHIGFTQENAERVNEIYRQLAADGFDVQPPQQHHAWTFYVDAPGGFTVEILA
jgi:lactoylglutathione lyase